MRSQRDLLILLTAFLLCPPLLAVEAPRAVPQGRSFFFAFGADVGAGTIGTKNQSVETRSLNAAAAFLQLGYSYGNLTPFVGAEYLVARQSTKASHVDNSNLGGEGYLATVGVHLDLGWFHLSGELVPYGVYRTLTSTVNGESSRYERPLGLIASVGLRFSDSFTGVVRYRNLEYQTHIINTSNFDIGQNPLIHSSVGLGLLWRF